MMIIRLTKGSGKPDTITCLRADRTTTWSRLHPGVGAQHDIVHYAVETTLGLKNSFYGLVARGIGIEDFNVRAAAQALNLPPEAGQTEFIVGLLQTEMSDGTDCKDFDDQMRIACTSKGTDPPAPIPPLMLNRIRTKIVALLRQWQALKPGEHLDLEFAETP